MHSENLSGDLATHLRTLVLRGDLQPGDRINEVHLAAALGVSRTPLREALTRLVGEGTLTSVPRKGFFVPELSLRELDQIYPIRAVLDPAALQAAGIPAADVLHDLEQLNEELVACEVAGDAIDLDDRWHRLLLAHCPNRILLDLIEQFMLKTRRYEIAYMRGRHLLQVGREHRAILEALRRGDVDAACRHLESNMTNGRGPIADWLRSHQEKDDPTP